MIQSIHCKTIFVSSITVNDWCQISQSIDVRCPSRLMSDVPVDWCQISQSIDVRYPSRLMSDIPVVFIKVHFAQIFVSLFCFSIVFEQFLCFRIRTIRLLCCSLVFVLLFFCIRTIRMKDNSDHLYGGPSGQSVLLGHQKDSFADHQDHLFDRPSRPDHACRSNQILDLSTGREFVCHVWNMSQFVNE